MESVLTTFSAYLLKNGICDQEGVNKIIKEVLFHCNNMKQDTVYSNSNGNNDDFLRDTIVFNLSKYLINVVKTNKLINISSQLYSKFVAQDDQNILKLLRKLFMHYNDKSKHNLTKAFFKWRVIGQKISNEENKTHISIENYYSQEDEKKMADFHYRAQKQVPEVNIVSCNPDSSLNIFNKINKTLHAAKNKMNEKSNRMIQNVDEGKNAMSKSFEKAQAHQTPRSLTSGKVNINNQYIHPNTEYQSIKKKGGIITPSSANHSNYDYSYDNGITQAQYKGSANLFDRLHKDASSREKKLIERQLESKKYELTDCTFNPKINNKSKILNNSGMEEDLISRLNKHVQEKDNKLRLLSLEKEKHLNEIYTFTPKLMGGAKFSNRSQSTFYDRQKNFEKNKEEKLQKIALDVYKPPQAPVYKKKDFSESTVLTAKERLDKLHKHYKEKKLQKSKKIEEEMMQEQGITFKPRLNDNINKVPLNIVERNEKFLKEKNSKLDSAKIKEQSSHPFSPQINEYQPSYISKKNNTNVSREGQSVSGMDMNQDNSMSMVAAEKEKNVGKRLYNYQQVYKKNNEEKAHKISEKERYSFKPEINKNTYDILKQRELELEDIKRRIAEKEKLKNKIKATNEKLKGSEGGKENEAQIVVDEMEGEEPVVEDYSDQNYPHNYHQAHNEPLTTEEDAYVDRRQLPNNQPKAAINSKNMAMTMNKVSLLSLRDEEMEVQSPINKNAMSSSNFSDLHTNPSKTKNTYQKFSEEDPYQYKSNFVQSTKSRQNEPLHIPTEDSLGDTNQKLILNKKIIELNNDKEEIKKICESTQKDKQKMDFTFGKVGINFPNTIKKSVPEENNDRQASLDRPRKPKVPKNIAKALEYYDIVYS